MVIVWRAYLGWRTSWLSREIIAFNIFAALAGALAVAPLFASRWERWLTLPAASTGLLAVAVSAMVYVDTRRPMWSAAKTFGNFLGSTLVSGSSVATVVLTWQPGGQTAMETAALRALVSRGLLLGWRWWMFQTAINDTHHPLHLNACAVKELLPWSWTAQGILCLMATFSGMLALFNVAHGDRWWAALSALATLGMEGLARHLFFTASADQRMPGGVVS